MIEKFQAEKNISRWASGGYDQGGSLKIKERHFVHDKLIFQIHKNKSRVGKL